MNQTSTDKLSIYYKHELYVQIYIVLKSEALFTWHFERDDILQKAGILGLFGQCV